MERDFFTNRIRKVINTCESIDQLEIARKYAIILIDRYIGDTGIKTNMKEKLLIWVDFLIESKKFTFN